MLPQNLIDQGNNEEEFRKLIEEGENYFTRLMAASVILGLERAKDIFNSEPEYFLHRVDELIQYIKDNISG